MAVLTKATLSSTGSKRRVVESVKDDFVVAVDGFSVKEKLEESKLGLFLSLIGTAIHRDPEFSGAVC